jgi:signal transduction histidine kinase/DNA-binding response OmpR family regulator
LLAWVITKSSSGRTLQLIKTTQRISRGDLETKNTIQGSDEIGQLAVAIDLMQTTLRSGKENIEQQNWLKTGIAQINTVSLGQDNINSLAEVIITEIATYINAGIGALYIAKEVDNEPLLTLTSSYAYSKHIDSPTQFKQGEGLIGQVALTRKPIMLTHASDHYLKIVSGISASTPAHICIIPILYENRLQGVIEIGTFDCLSPVCIQYLTLVTEVVAKAIEITSAQDTMKRQQLELTKANAKLTELDQMKTNFLSTVSHELRTPLTSVIGFAQIMQKKFECVLYPALAENTDKKVVKAIRQVMDNTAIIVEEGERLTALINNVLDLAKMEAGRVDWHITDLSIEDIIDRSIASTSSLFANKPVNLIKEVPTNLPLCLGDHDRLIQVIINLISNAIKFTDKGKVILKAKQGRNELIVSVIDSGIGIRPEDQPLVFEKFKQVGDTMTDKPQGTGLGLPICKEIIEHLGGRIWVESKIGVGSTFLFSLPLTKHQQNHLSHHNESALKYKNILLTNEGEKISYIWHTESKALENALKASLDQPAQHQETTTPNILIIDDNLNIREFLHQELSAANYEVREASSGAEGLAMIEDKKPDLIILDVKMPDLNGFEVAVRLHTNPLTLQIPIILHTITENRALGEQLGIDCYLNKPVNDAVLLRAVNHLLGASHTRKKILLFIADSEKRQLWVNLLIDCGFETMATDNVSEGIKSASAFDPQLVITETSLANKFKIIEQLRDNLGLDKVLFTFLDEPNVI